MKKNKNLLSSLLVLILVVPISITSTLNSNKITDNDSYSKTKPSSEPVELSSSYSLFSRCFESVEEYFRESLSDMNPQTNLGNILDNKPQTILDRFSKLNPEIEVDQLEVSEISFEDAFIGTKKNGKYRGKVFVEFKIKNLSLKKRIPNRDLGFIQGFSEDIIKQRLSALNSELKIQEITIINMTKNSATVKVKPNSKEYDPKETVEICYTVPKFSIKDHFNTTIPLKVREATYESIKSSLKKLYKDLDLTQVNIPKSKITRDSFQIKANDSSEIYRDEG